MKPGAYGPFPYSPIIRRPRLSWPGNARVALWIIPNIEFFALDDMVPGAWLADADNRVQFHLIAKDDEHNPGPDARMTPAGRHTAWMVKDINAFKARMRGLAIAYEETSALIGGAQVFVKDPAGHTWEFQEPAKR